MTEVAQARVKARSILVECGIATPPVPLDRIAKHLKARVQYAPLDGDLSGLAYVKDDVAIVGVNSLHAPMRQRFTLAHELAHIVLHRDILESGVHVDRVLLRDRKSSQGSDLREIVANAFAAELLVPSAMLEVALAGRAPVEDDDEEIAGLARKFRVSESAMRYRLMNVA